VSTGGPAGFGSGGMPNNYPSRAEALDGTNNYYRDLPDWVGGARGPAALPSRTTTINGPAPAQAIHGAQGPISYHRGDYIEDPGAPRLYFDNVLGHGDISWSRPTYANMAGRSMYHSPTQQPSWTANTDLQQDGPTVPIPVQNKHIGNFTVRRPYGDNSSGMEFKTGSLAQFVASIQVGMNQQGKRWLSQAKTHNPWQPNLSNWGPAGSYGQTTSVLKTQPTFVPASYDEYGAY
jgi:hypothetical protein